MCHKGDDDMTNYGIVKSTVKPEPMVIDENSVWIYKNIRLVDGEWEYEMIQYNKDEYIKLLDTQLTDTQLALVEIYERMM
jgi:hypothetical protein